MGRREQPVVLVLTVLPLFLRCFYKVGDGRQYKKPSDIWKFVDLSRLMPYCTLAFLSFGRYPGLLCYCCRIVKMGG